MVPAARLILEWSLTGGSPKVAASAAFEPDGGAWRRPATPLGSEAIEPAPWSLRFPTPPPLCRRDSDYRALESDRPIVDAVRQVAEARRIPMAQVALAWVLKNPVVTAPIVGPTKPHHLADAVSALDVHLTEEEIRTLA